MDFPEPAQDIGVLEARFFADLALGSLLGGLTFLDVAFRDRPAFLSKRPNLSWKILSLRQITKTPSPLN